MEEIVWAGLSGDDLLTVSPRRRGKLRPIPVDLLPEPLAGVEEVHLLFSGGLNVWMLAQSPVQEGRPTFFGSYDQEVGQGAAFTVALGFSCCGWATVAGGSHRPLVELSFFSLELPAHLLHPLPGGLKFLCLLFSLLFFLPELPASLLDLLPRGLQPLRLLSVLSFFSLELLAHLLYSLPGDLQPLFLLPPDLIRCLTTRRARLD